jgi:hypothetical protein
VNLEQHIGLHVPTPLMPNCQASQQHIGLVRCADKPVEKYYWLIYCERMKAQVWF